MGVSPADALMIFMTRAGRFCVCVPMCMWGCMYTCMRACEFVVCCYLATQIQEAHTSLHT